MTFSTDIAVLERFQHLKSLTECRYARGTQLLAAASPDGVQGLHRVLSAMDAVTGSMKDWDGVVLEIASPTAGSTIEALADTTSQVLGTLSGLDGTLLTAADVLDPSWWFRCRSMAWFVSAFAPCYPSNSSRFNFGSDRTYLVFLSAESFRRRRRTGENELPQVMKEAIRAAFAHAGRPYDLSLTLSDYEAERIVKPVDFGAPSIRWWEHL